MKTSIYEHRSGLRVIPEDILKDVINVVEEMSPVLSKNTVTQIKKGLKKGLEIKGWSGEYRLDANSKITISSYMRGVGMCADRQCRQDIRRPVKTPGFILEGKHLLWYYSYSSERYSKRTRL